MVVAKWSVYSRIGLAEREGFEPSVPGASPVQRFSNSLYLLRRPAIPTAYSCTTAPNLTQGDLIRQLRDTVRGTDPSSQKPRHPVKIFVPLRVQFSRNFRNVTLGQCVMATNQRLGLIFGDRTATPYELLADGSPFAWRSFILQLVTKEITPYRQSLLTKVQPQ